MNAAMLQLRAWFARHDLPIPDGIEFRFSDEGAAYRFDAALKMDFERNSGAYVLDLKSGRVSQVCVFTIQPTFQKYGPPYSLNLLPAHHPAVKSNDGR